VFSGAFNGGTYIGSVDLTMTSDTEVKINVIIRGDNSYMRAQSVATTIAGELLYKMEALNPATASSSLRVL